MKSARGDEIVTPPSGVTMEQNLVDDHGEPTNVFGLVRMSHGPIQVYARGVTANYYGTYLRYDPNGIEVQVRHLDLSAVVIDEIGQLMGKLHIVVSKQAYLPEAYQALQMFRGRTAALTAVSRFYDTTPEAPDSLLEEMGMFVERLQLSGPLLDQEKLQIMRRLDELGAVKLSINFGHTYCALVGQEVKQADRT